MTHPHRSLAGPEKSTRIRRLRADQLAGPRLGVDFPAGGSLGVMYGSLRAAKLQFVHFSLIQRPSLKRRDS